MTRAERLEAAVMRERHLAQAIAAEIHRLHALNCPICRAREHEGPHVAVVFVEEREPT